MNCLHLRAVYLCGKHTVLFHSLLPSKCCFPHSEVEISRVDTINLDAIVLIHEVENRAQSIDIPFVTIFIR